MQAQLLMAVLVAVSVGEGVSTTETASPSAVASPVTVITPVVPSIAMAETYLVATKDAAQVSRFDAPDDCTISVTQVRAELAASTTSETLAFFV